MKFVENYNKYKEKYVSICEGTLKQLIGVLQDYELRTGFNIGEYSSSDYKKLTREEKQYLDETLQNFTKFYKETVDNITTNPQYASWIYDRLIGGDIQPEYFLTQFYVDVKRVLNQFIILCRSPKITSVEKNIQTYKSFYQLEQFVKQHVDLLTKNIKITFDKVFSNDMFDIYKVGKEDKSLFQQLYGETGYNCGWCVVNSNRTEFDKYLNDDDPNYYLWTYKGTNKPYALFHLGSEQFKDIHNKVIMRQVVHIRSDELYHNVLSGLKFLIKNKQVDFDNDLATYRFVLKNN